MPNKENPTEIIMVRHGQANTGATSEDDYDRLSDLGHQQAAWLGDYFADQDPFDHVICGTLRRHRETAEGLQLANSVADDARLNEMRYFDLAFAMQQKTGMDVPTTAESFAMHVPLTFTAWSHGDLDHAHETYADFRLRIEAVVAEATQRGGRTLLVTSGGVISMFIAAHLELDPAQHARILLPIRNSSLHRFQIFDSELFMAGYNAIPHLEPSDRAHARTTI